MSLTATSFSGQVWQSQLDTGCVDIVESAPLTEAVMADKTCPYRSFAQKSTLVSPSSGKRLKVLRSNDLAHFPAKDVSIIHHAVSGCLWNFDDRKHALLLALCVYIQPYPLLPIIILHNFHYPLKQLCEILTPVTWKVCEILTLVTWSVFGIIYWLSIFGQFLWYE